MISIWVFFGSQISLIATLFCSLLQLGFLIFFLRIWCGPESYSRPGIHNQSNRAICHSELSVWTREEWVHALPFLVQAASQWRDDFPYSSGIFWPGCEEWPLLCKLSESTELHQPHHFSLTASRLRKVLLCSLGTHSAWSNGKSCTKTPELNKWEPPCCKTLAEMHTCRPQMRNGNPVVVSSVVWIRGFNFKQKLLACHLETGVQSNFLLIHSWSWIFDFKTILQNTHCLKLNTCPIIHQSGSFT